MLEGFAAPNMPGSDTFMIDVRSTTIGGSASAKEVAQTERTFEITGDTLRYTMRMGAVGLPFQHHLVSDPAPRDLTVTRVGSHIGTFELAGGRSFPTIDSMTTSGPMS